MQEPKIFNTGKGYMDKGERKAVLTFHKNLPDMSFVYKNDKGKELQVVKFVLPLGTLLPDSKMLGQDEKDGTEYYTTVHATGVFGLDEKKVVRVWVKNLETKETVIITGNQWLEFAKGSSSSKVQIPESPSFGKMGKKETKAYLQSLKAAQSVDNKESEIESEVTKRVEKQKGPKKSAKKK